MRLSGPPAPTSKFATLVEALHVSSQSAHGITYVDGREQETLVPYAELPTRAAQIAAGLVERGVERGDRVAIVLPTSPSFVDVFFGVLLAGAVPVPLYPPLRLGRLDAWTSATARMLIAAGACLVVTDPRIQLFLGQTVAEARPRLGVAIAAALAETRNGLVARDAAIARDVGPDDLALVQFSSGTTVDPKPVALTHAAVLAQCAAVEATIGRDERHLCVSWLPLYHDMGLIGALLGAVTYPGPLVLIPPEVFLARPALWLRAISRHRATITAAPSFAYSLAAKRCKQAELVGVDLSSLRFALDGAEPVSLEGAASFASFAAPYGFDPRAHTPVYGLAEATLAVSFHPPRDTDAARALFADANVLARDRRYAPGARPLVSVGRPLAGVSIEIRDEEGHALEEGQVGAVFVRTPARMREYLGNELASRRALTDDGWLDTADLGFVHGGELYLCGRARDVVIVRGENHDAHAIEATVAQLEGVRPGGVAAVGHANEEGLEELLMFVEPSGATEPPDATEALVARVRAAVLAGTGLKARVVIVPPRSLPRTSSGKLRRRETLRRHLAGECEAPRTGLLETLGSLSRSAAAYLARGT